MFHPDKDGVLAVVGASTGRRVVACGVIYVLGMLLIYVALGEPPALPLLLLVLALGIGSLVLAEALRRATLSEIMMTADTISTSDGMVIARIDDIVSVDRGAFAFKPSNGFTLKLKTKQPRGWAPGLWWRFGRYVGVGGAVSAGQSKFMAEQIALQVATRSAK
ncbi:hypothetical protein FHS72_002923 [Loktanella ponticola]|uniref:DUF304 domain-containing protein n=1 Tax=Yoonia ponticola TaxID=1524255 RepID=A0A7W9BMJ1_9RHOB|nr:hypothetical protein [Yoonia ponticola]MBB5723283.1 hypothetical protein [Yoonia ponticola]